MLKLRTAHQGTILIAKIYEFHGHLPNRSVAPNARYRDATSQRHNSPAVILSNPGSQPDSCVNARFGSPVVAKKTSGVCDRGERGVVYEAYELGKPPGWSVIFQNGRHDGFSPSNVDFFLDVIEEVCEDLTSYKFENVLRLVDDFGRGAFAPPALGPEGHHTTLERWFLIWHSDSNAST